MRIGSHKTVISFEFERIFHLGSLTERGQIAVAVTGPPPRNSCRSSSYAAVSGGFCAALPVGSFKLLSSRKLKPAYQAVFVERDVRLRHGTGGSWVQADRGAMASQGVFLPGDKRDAYLAGEPADDTRFVAAFAHSLEHSGGYTPEEAQRVAKTLLPDIMHYDHTRPASYPDNGRTLTDRALDYFLSVLTNGKIKTDGVAAHSDLLADFPYLGPPHRDGR